MSLGREYQEKSTNRATKRILSALYTIESDFRRLVGTIALRGPRRFFSCAAGVVAPHLTAC